jgi:hypothetical protein
MRGTLSYKNVGLHTFCGCVGGGKLKICHDAILKLYQDLTFNEGLIIFEDGALLLTAEGKMFNSKISAAGCFVNQQF